MNFLIKILTSVKVGILESKSKKDLGIAGIIAAVLIAKGASWGFAIGIVLVFLIYGKDFFKSGGDDGSTKNFLI